ncbi:hypothetical protein SHKM778_40660 [Streptomyces sp. KM77-8]|uniref:Histidine kinase/HSP90-like ATPase domain-containing protein n=1 Tax=Streptomyces haneummycinicus TaxID=3074435 RepID=A0AAT9HKL7_9ACTN
MPRVRYVPVQDSTRVRDVRVAAEEAAAEAGLDDRRTAAAALVATELATNLLKYAQAGEVIVEVVDPPVLREGRPDRVVQITALDHGPGIADVAGALRDGFTTTRSLGAGLGTCRRIADDFGLHSVLGRGTVAVARVGPVGGSGAAGVATALRGRRRLRGRGARGGAHAPSPARKAPVCTPGAATDGSRTAPGRGEAAATSPCGPGASTCRSPARTTRGRMGLGAVR